MKLKIGRYNMDTIKIKIERTFKFEKGGGCEKCDMYEYCNEVDGLECDMGEIGHYEDINEEIEQLNYIKVE